MGEQVEEINLLTTMAFKFRNDLHHAGGQGKLAKLDGAQYQSIGKGFGQ